MVRLPESGPMGAALGEMSTRFRQWEAPPRRVPSPFAFPSRRPAPMRCERRLLAVGRWPLALW